MPQLAGGYGAGHEGGATLSWGQTLLLPLTGWLGAFRQMLGALSLRLLPQEMETTVPASTGF